MKPTDPMNYHFSGFNYDTEQKILKKGSQILKLTKKNHTLLGYLLSRPQQLISREELIDHVWQGRVVTNNTIDQCILKLRKVLNNAHEGDYIESVYGQGIRFLPATSSGGLKTDATNPYKFKLEWLILLLAICFLFLWLIFRAQNKDSSLQFDSKSIDTQVISQAELPINQANHNWLHAGGSAYLSQLLSQYPNLNPQKPRRIENKNQDSQALAIDLSGDAASKIVLKVDVQPQHIQIDTAYIAELTLQNVTGIVVTKKIESSQLTQLYPMIADWVAQQLGKEASIESQDPQVYSGDEQALQSYFKAMSTQANGDSRQAITFLQTALEHDPSFKMAWYEMAVALRKQGDPRKAIGVLNAITSGDPYLTYKITLIKAQCFDSVGEFEAATETYAKALLLAKNSQDPSKLAAVYISQAILYRKTEQYQLAEQALDQAELVTDASSQPQLFGTIMNTYAKLARNTNQPILAIEKAKLAIDAFQRSGDLRYQMQAKTVLASILIQRNEFPQAEQLVKESLFHAEQLNNRRGISDNRTKLARLYQQTGKFRLAHEQWQLVLALNVELELYANTASAYSALLQLHLLENNATQAEIDLKMLAQLYNEHPTDEINQSLTEAQLILAIYNQDTATSQQQLASLITNGHDLASMYQGDVAMLQQNSAAAELHYLEALISINPVARYDQMVLVLNRLNALYLIHNTHKLADNLIRTQRLKPFIYPIQKYQAQAAIAADNHIKAISLMEELKLKAGDFWQYPDQLLLESMQKQ